MESKEHLAAPTSASVGVDRITHDRKKGPARLGRGLFDYELFPDGRSKCALANLLGSFERHRGYLEAPLDSIFYTVLATLCAHLERGVDRLEHDGTLEHDHRLLVSLSAFSARRAFKDESIMASGGDRGARQAKTAEASLRSIFNPRRRRYWAHGSLKIGCISFVRRI